MVFVKNTWEMTYPSLFWLYRKIFKISKMAAAILNISFLRGWRKIDWWSIVALRVLNKDQQSNLGAL